MPAPTYSPAWNAQYFSTDPRARPLANAARRRSAKSAHATSDLKLTSGSEPEAISPLMLAKTKEVDDFSLDQKASDSLSSVPKRRNSTRRARAFSSSSPRMLPAQHARKNSKNDDAPASHPDESQIHNLLDQVVGWLHDEKRKRHDRQSRHHHFPSRKSSAVSAINGAADPSTNIDDSSDSEGSLALGKLENILKSSSFVDHIRRRSSTRPVARNLRHSSSVKRLRRPSTLAASSDTEYVEGDAIVPSCDVVLDNSKTLSYGGGASSSQLSVTDESLQKNREAWNSFKFEIVRLTHTLRIKGWRAVAMEQSGEIEVERLSGALTNAVYVVTPPRNLVPLRKDDTHSSDQNLTLSQQRKRRMPKKLLLRIYGPQVEHLIDRDNELMILRRLARQRIGPRLLGTFINGRFEEFFHAKTLTPKDLREPQTSMQIAKRMRELHDGIELLDDERRSGPFMWRNWDKWLERCERIVSHVDRQIQTPSSRRTSTTAKLQQRGFICGTPWPMFRRAVEKYRAWLQEQYGGADGVRDNLVFAHNDTQYGNILRLEPPGESPLLLPANKHKQLVVIDFEYASANTPGLEFANHFTEWCYNYHDPLRSFACNTAHYPGPEEQARFLRAYAAHKPAFAPAASTPRLSASTPSLAPRTSYTSSAAASRRPTFSRADSSASTTTTAAALPQPLLTTSTPSLTEEPQSLAKTDSNTSTDTASTTADAALASETHRLARETWLWRAANSAQWVAWGIVQARVPGLASGGAEQRVATTTAEGDEADDEEDEDEFDYLSYARERALFFWGDAVQLGIVDETALPRDVRDAMKIVRH